jgi:hypothetical protein
LPPFVEVRERARALVLALFVLRPFVEVSARALCVRMSTPKTDSKVLLTRFETQQQNSPSIIHHSSP